MNSVFDIRGRRALVLGGTSGLGREVAFGYAQAGAHVIATGRRADAVAAVTRGILEHGVESFEITCDAADPRQVADLRGAVEERWGQLDILVYAAGMTFKQPTADVPIERWRSLLATNLDGALSTFQNFYNLLKQSPYPRGITFASLSSYRAFHEVAAYAASKAALLSLTQSLACEWAPSGIRVNAIVPGVFVTDINRELLNETTRGHELLMRTPMKRFGEVSELVGTAIFLASDAASYITGAAIPVDGGFLASGVNQ